MIEVAEIYLVVAAVFAMVYVPLGLTILEDPEKPILAVAISLTVSVVLWPWFVVISINRAARAVWERFDD